MGCASAFCLPMNAENAPALSEQVTASQPEHCPRGSPGWKEACPGHTVSNDQPAWSPGLRTYWAMAEPLLLLGLHIWKSLCAMLGAEAMVSVNCEIMAASHLVIQWAGQKNPGKSVALDVPGKYKVATKTWSFRLHCFLSHREKGTAGSAWRVCLSQGIGSQEVSVKSLIL